MGKIFLIKSLYVLKLSEMVEEDQLHSSLSFQKSTPFSTNILLEPYYYAVYWRRKTFIRFVGETLPGFLSIPQTGGKLSEQL